MSSPLGRGLSALIPTKDTVPSPASGERVVLLPVDTILPNPHQPRLEFDPTQIAELAESIRAHGVLSPLIVTNERGAYYLIAGERRLRASKSAGLASVPCIVRSASEQNRLEQAVVENVQRQDLNPIEEAKAYRRLMDEFRLTQEQVGKRVGKSRAGVANTLRLLALPENIIAAISSGKITMGHAKVLLGLQPSEQQAYFQRVVGKQMSVRALEDAVAGTAVRAHTRQGSSPDVVALEQRLRQKLSAKVIIRGGKIVITYHNAEELREIVKRVLGQ